MFVALSEKWIESVYTQAIATGLFIKISSHEGYLAWPGLSSLGSMRIGLVTHS